MTGVSLSGALKAGSPMLVAWRQTTLASVPPVSHCGVVDTVPVDGNGESLPVSGGSVASTSVPVVSTGESTVDSVTSASESGESPAVRPLTRGIPWEYSALWVVHRSFARPFCDLAGAYRSPTGRNIALALLSLAYDDAEGAACIARRRHWCCVFAARQTPSSLLQSVNSRFHSRKGRFQ
jgi:hypothetical protein